jgi:hypothetical protein
MHPPDPHVLYAAQPCSAQRKRKEIIKSIPMRPFII